MKNHMDLKNMRATFLKYLLPSVAAMWVFSIYTMVDGIFVGRYVGAKALAAINLSMPIVNLIFAVSLMIAIGSSTMISINLGKKNSKEANSLFTLSLVFLFVISIIFILLGELFLKDIIIFLGAKGEIFEMSRQYLRIIIFFNGSFMIAYALETLVKADGYPIFSIVGVFSAAICNIVLDYIFVAKFQMGVSGAAWATGISQFSSCIIFITHFFSNKSKLKFSKFKFANLKIINMVKIGFPDCITEFSTGVVLFMFNHVILSQIGELGVSVFGVIGYVNNLVIMTMIGIAQGMQPVVSFCEGRKDYESQNQILTMALKTSLIIGFIFFLASSFYGDVIMKLFLKKENPNVYSFGLRAIRIFGISFILSGINICVSAYFTALAKTTKSFLVSISRGFVMILFSLILMVQLFGSKGIWYSVSIAEALTLILSIKLLLKQKQSQKEEQDEENQEEKALS